MASEDIDFHLLLQAAVGGCTRLRILQSGLFDVTFRNAIDRRHIFEILAGWTSRGVVLKELNGVSLQGLPTHELVRRGFGFGSGRHPVIPGLRVREHFLLHLGSRRRLASSRTVGAVYELLASAGIGLDDRAGNLSGGQQQAVMLGLAIAGAERIAVIEEPWLGLAASLLARFKDLVRSLPIAAIVLRQEAQDTLGTVEPLGRVVVSSKAREENDAG